jgi:hypothetical protein
LGIDGNLPRVRLIDGAWKIADMVLIWKVFGFVISVGLKQQIALFGSGLSQKIIPAVSDLKGRY